MISQYFANNLFSQSNVFVTGGGGTINLAIAKGIGSLGANVVLAGRTLDRIDKCRDELKSVGIEATSMYVDVQNISTIETALTQTKALYGPINILICGAAANFPAPAEQMTAEGFAKVISIDLIGSFNASRAAFDQLRQTKGNIVYISATNAVMPFAFQAHVGAAKAGIDSLMRGLALEWGKYGIRCNSVLPGPIEKTEGLRRLLTEDDIKVLSDYVPIGRFGTVEDVAGVVAFLASPLAGLLTGVTLIADGGQSFSGSAMLADMMSNY
ncbi:ptzO [Candidatus Endolissoclinum faulkneri L5]|uniref:PtzO n=1 Tax=Candidatus Endolissoclinum faulkneri L5 TaxID=1401328 RepID=V9TVX2_9PROT|nr:SDR family oxidoreductase [Candidatus Endolissoclinum faulkneri]AHC73480.1 ptzO [Candidatus Endolissoclinum faulkneri L5]